MPLTHCTLTGVDATTQEYDLFRLSERYPVAEWGLLYSPKRQGQPGRYPSIDHLFDALAHWPKSLRVAVHLCGDAVRHAIEGEPIAMEILDLVRARHGRIQLNIRQVAYEAKDTASLDGQTDTRIHESDLFDLLARHPDVPFILQRHAGTEHVGRGRMLPPNYSILFDASGGRGIPATSWVPPLEGVPCGYAGGLSPATIHSALTSLHALTPSPFWIDMESSLRDERDRFDLDRAESVLRTASEFLSSMPTGTVAL